MYKRLKLNWIGEFSILHLVHIHLAYINVTQITEIVFLHEIFNSAIKTDCVWFFATIVYRKLKKMVFFHIPANEVVISWTLEESKKMILEKISKSIKPQPFPFVCLSPNLIYILYRLKNAVFNYYLSFIMINWVYGLKASTVYNRSVVKTMYNTENVPNAYWDCVLHHRKCVCVDTYAKEFRGILNVNIISIVSQWWSVSTNHSWSNSTLHEPHCLITNTHLKSNSGI